MIKIALLKIVRFFYRLLSKIIYLVIPIISKILIILKLNSRIINQLNKLRSESHRTQNHTSFVKNLLCSDNKFIANIIEEKVGEIIGKVKRINSKQSFPISAHINEKFFNKRLIYIGDSAHSIHPIAGQGWNLGIKDVKHVMNLCKTSELDIGDENFCKNYTIGVFA